MWKKLICLIFLIVVLGLADSTVGAPSISNITTNEGDYPGSEIPRYKKLEITFDVNNVSASNLQLPYDASPPSGLTAGVGITVNGKFTPDNWTTTYTQPAFYYQEFEHQTKNSKDWMYPTDNYSWKVRFAPKTAGNWKFKLTAQDSGGSTESSEQSFTVVSSSEPGFLKVSANDLRYFEFENGDFFEGLGYNLRFNQLYWDDPNTKTRPAFQELNGYGCRLFRTWITHWGIYTDAWGAWNSPNSALHGGYMPQQNCTMAVDTPDPDSGVSMILYTNGSPPSPVMWMGHMKRAPAVKQNTTYHIFVEYYIPADLSGPRVGGNPYGLVCKTSGWNTQLMDSGQGTVVSDYAYAQTADWSILEGSFSSGSNNWIPGGFFSLCLENVNTSGNTVAYINYVEICEDLGGGQYGPNIVYQPWMSKHLCMDLRQSFSLDRTIEYAEENDIYLKLVMLEKNSWILDRIDYDGNNVPGSPSNDYFYGNYRNMTKVRWLQNAWWRYSQARWGYSTSIHSWELLNEGDPWNSRHYTLADEYGEYMHQFTHNDHLVTTSHWHSWPLTQFWANSEYPNVDYADLHRYETSQTDCALSTYTQSMDKGAYQTNGADKPAMRGETGFNSDVNQDTDGTWFHNYTWGTINPGGMYEEYWDQNNEFGQSYDPREHFLPYRHFIEDIPLNNGNYEDANATVSDPDLRAWGQKDLVNEKAHLWIQNSTNTYKGNPSPQSGNIQFGGLAASTDYTVEWWDPYEPNKAIQIASSDTIATDSSGVLTLSVTSLADDVAVKVKPIEAGPPGKATNPNPANEANDVDVDAILSWTAGSGATSRDVYFGTSSPGDFKGNQTETTYNPPGTMNYNTTYYWRIDEKNEYGTTTGDVWSFTTETAPPPALPWSDDFESGNLNNWTVSGSASASTQADYTGTYGAKLPGTGWIEKAISTEGYTSIHVKYARTTKSMDSGEYLYIEWYDGSDWNELEATNATSWSFKDMTCGTGANNNASFKVRFRTNADKTNEHGCVDDVEITGTAQ